MYCCHIHSEVIYVVWAKLWIRSYFGYEICTNIDQDHSLQNAHHRFRHVQCDGTMMKLLLQLQFLRFGQYSYSLVGRLIIRLPISPSHCVNQRRASQERDMARMHKIDGDHSFCVTCKSSIMTFYNVCLLAYVGFFRDSNPEANDLGLPCCMNLRVKMCKI